MASSLLCRRLNHQKQIFHKCVNIASSSKSLIHSTLKLSQYGDNSNNGNNDNMFGNSSEQEFDFDTDNSDMDPLGGQQHRQQQQNMGGFGGNQRGGMGFDARSQGQSGEAGSKLSGEVKWFDSSKGFGFIIADNNEEYFVHYSSLHCDSHFKSVEQGSRVEFELQQGNRGKLQAMNVTGPGGVHVQQQAMQQSNSPFGRGGGSGGGGFGGDFGGSGGYSRGGGNRGGNRGGFGDNSNNPFDNDDDFFGNDSGNSGNNRGNW